MEGDSPEDISNKARGHKANLSNPNTSEESKAHSREVLDSLPDNPMGVGEGKDPKNVARGLKATINNPGISDETKRKAQEQLDDMN
jgi:hypothetical protein